MKRFQRVSAFLMALALIVGLLPAGGFPMRSAAAAETNPAVGDGNTYLRAVYQASGANVDGAADNTYPLTVALSDSVMMGAAWDATYLYLSVNSAVELAELKLNDAAITEKAVTAAAGEDPGYAEYRIALMDADAPSLDVCVNTVTVKLTEGAEAQTFYLIFDNNTYHRYELVCENGGAVVDENDSYKGSFNIANLTGSNNYLTAVDSSVTGSLGITTVVEVDIDITALNGGYTLAQNVGTNTRYINMGANIQVIDAFCEEASNKVTEAFLFGFTKDKTSGDLYFQSAVSTGEGTFGSSDVLLSETISGLYHVRVEYTYAADGSGAVSHDSVVSAKYFVNGKLIDEQSNVRVSKTGKALINNVRGVKAYTSNKTDTNFTVSNISVSYDNPTALAALKAAYVAGRQGPDQAAATLVASQIAALPAVSELALTDKAAVEAARAAYEDLTTAQKAYVEEATLNTLVAAEAEIARLFVLSRQDYLFADAAGGIVLDGQIESAYRMNIPFTPTTQMGTVWDLNNLYLAITGADLGEMTNVSLGGKSVTALKAAGGNEYSISLASLELNVDTLYDLTFTLGGMTWTGKVMLGTDDYATLKLNASTNSTVDADLLNRVAYLDTTENKGQAITTVTNCYKAEGLPEATTIFECDIKFNAIPDNGKLSGYSRAFCQGGIGIVFRDQDTTLEGANICEAFLIGLYKENGVMKLGYWDNTANNGAGGYVSENAGDAVAGQYHIRAEFTYPENVLSNDIAAKYYVNGSLVAQTTSAKQSGGSKGTGAPLGLSFDAYNNDQGRVDAVVSNVSVSHAKGLEAVKKELDQTVPAQTNILLQLGANKSEMNFTWFSQSEAQGIIKYAEASKLVDGELPQDAATATATREDYNKKAGYVNNKATITELKPDTTYYYQLINGDDMTELKSFKTGADGDFSFAFVGDPQIGGSGDKDKLNSDLIDQHLKEEAEHWGMTLGQIKNEGVDFIVSAGDQTDTHAYNFWDKTDIAGMYGIHEQQFDAFANQDVLQGLPIVTVTGNHDDDTYPIYANHVNLPNMLINPETNDYYGATYTGGTNFTGADYYFTYNNVLFLVLNTNTYYYDRTNSGEHLEFIDKVLEKTAGQTFDWTIAIYHESPYGSSYHRDPERGEAESYARMRTELVPKLYEAGVDMILSGHDHCYTRTYVLKPGVENGEYTDSYVIQNQDAAAQFSNADGIFHVVGGTGSASQVNEVEFVYEEMAKTATANTRMMTKIEVTGDTLTLITYNMGTQLSNNMQEIDRFVLTNNGDATVEAAIDAIGNVTVDSEDKIEAARAAYDALSPQLKKRVANYKTLTKAEAAFEALKENAEKIAAVQDAIDALNVNATDKAALSEAIAAAEAKLTELDTQLQARVDQTNLEAAKARLAVLEAVAEVEAKIDNLPDVNELTLEAHKNAVNEANSAYEALGENKNLVNTAKAEKLAAAIEKIAQLELAAENAEKIAAVQDAIDDLNVNATDKTALSAAIAAAEAKLAELDAQLQALVDQTTLEAAKARLAVLEAAAEVEAKIDNLPDVNELTLEAHKDAVNEANTAYEALGENKNLVNAAKVEKLAAAVAKIDELDKTAKVAAVQAVMNALDANATDKAALSAAIAAAEAKLAELDAQLQTRVDQTKLTAAKARLAVLEAVAEVEAKIDALPDANDLNLQDHQEVVNGVSTAYAALDTNKGLVDAAKKQKLEAAEAKIQELIEAKIAANKAAAKEVDDKIAALPTVGQLVLTDKPAVVLARAAYEALEDDQEQYVNNLSVLEAAEAKIQELQAAADKEAADKAEAAAVDALIQALPTVNELKLTDKGKVEAARAAHTGLTDDQKTYVTKLAVLEAAEAKLQELQAAKEAADQAAAKAAADKIDAIGTVTLNSKTAIEAARAAYDALTADQKALVKAETLKTLTDAEAALKVLEEEAADQAAAKAAADKIDAIGTVTLSSKTAIEAARAAYNALTAEQKALVKAETLKTLTDAETALKALQEEADKNTDNQAVADAVAEKIDAIGTVTLSSQAVIKAARAAYDALTAEQKALVSVEALKKLTDAEAALKTLLDADEAPKTGDTAMIVPVVLLVALSFAGMAVLVTGKKRFF